MKKLGSLNKHAELKIPVTTNEYGIAVHSWATLGKVWIDIMPISGTERLRAGAQAVEVSHRIRMRQQNYEFDETAKLVYGTREFQIKSILGEDNDELVLDCSEVKD